MFYIKLFFGMLWFIALTIVGLAMVLVNRRNPNIASFYARWMTRGVLKVFGIRLDIRNRERIFEAGPSIIVGNHQSNFDVVIHGAMYPPRCVAIGKKEVMRIPLWGYLFRETGNILLDRQNREKAWAGIAEARQAILAEGKWIYIFPEGHRSYSSELGAFKKGAFHMAISAQCPIVPVMVSPTLPLFNEKTREARRGTVQIQVMEPIPTKGMTIDQIGPLMETVRAKMIEEQKKLKTTVAPRFAPKVAL